MSIYREMAGFDGGIKLVKARSNSNLISLQHFFHGKLHSDYNLGLDYTLILQYLSFWMFHHHRQLFWLL